MSVVPFQDLPLADRGRRWTGDAADKRVRRWAGAQEEPTMKYRRAFIWYDKDAPGNFGSYKLQIADVIGGSSPPSPAVS